jgi:N-acyl-D-aspartate/D-glutamate deacylase
LNKWILFLVLLVSLTTIARAQQYDVVIEGGRVMDPETGMDAVRNLGIRDGKIASISSKALSGRRIIHAGVRCGGRGR